MVEGKSLVNSHLLAGQQWFRAVEPQGADGEIVLLRFGESFCASLQWANAPSSAQLHLEYWAKFRRREDNRSQP